MRFLPISGFIAFEFIYQMIKPNSWCKEEANTSIQTLLKLRIIGSPETPESGPVKRKALDVTGSLETETSFLMNKYFQLSLQKALSNIGASPWSEETLKLSPPWLIPTKAEIETFASQKWNNMLHFLLGTSEAPTPDARVVELLVSTKLLHPGQSPSEVSKANGVPFWLLDEEDEEENADKGVGSTSKEASKSKRKALSFQEIMLLGKGSVYITPRGYEFLLQETKVQLWTFIHEYISTSASREIAVCDILGFLFELGFCKQGKGYAISGLTRTQQSLLKDFASFGLLHIPLNQQPAGAPSAGPHPLVRFYPTSLAIAITHSNPQHLFHSPETSSSVSIVNLQLVVEKNFKLYAYTNVDLHVALLSLFTKVEARLPNMVVATLTRKSVMRAMEKGITAELIRSFLTSHAHRSISEKLSGEAAIPENVLDQLFLWQNERHRIQYKRGILLHSFDEYSDEYEACSAFLLSKRGIVSRDDQRKCIVMKESCLEDFKTWLADRSRGQ
jgi:Transcription factor Tfb2/Transcription factor Tfb2 (p52) C-terminal domain